MKTIGVIGGLGPQATMEFEAHVHRAAQRVIPPRENQGYPPTLVWYCRHAPFVMDDAGRPVRPLQPDPRLLDAAARLAAAGADFLVIVSNGAHAVADAVARAAGRPVVSMIDATVAEVRRRGWKRVGLLALGPPAVYLAPLADLGLSCETIDGPLRDALDAAIFRTMEGRRDEPEVAAARNAVAELRSRTVDGVVLGCTEIPVLLGEAGTAAADLLNPTQLLAEAAVRAAMADEAVAARANGKT